MTSPPFDPVADLARRLGLTNPSEEQLERVADALTDAEDDVVGYLGRPIRPEQRTAYRVWPDPLSELGWGVVESDPIRRLVSIVAETVTDGGQTITTGTFTVTYEVGLDYLNDPALRPIARYVRAAAMNDPTLLQFLSRSVGLRGPVQSVSVSTEGQSKNVSYAQPGYGGGGQAGADSPGALPSRTTLDRWRFRGRRVHQAPDQPPDPRVGGAGGYARDRDGFWNRPL